MNYIGYWTISTLVLLKTNRIFFWIIIFPLNEYITKQKDSLNIYMSKAIDDISDCNVFCLLLFSICLAQYILHNSFYTIHFTHSSHFNSFIHTEDTPVDIRKPCLMPELVYTYLYLYLHWILNTSLFQTLCKFWEFQTNGIQFVNETWNESVLKYI